MTLTSREVEIEKRVKGVCHEVYEVLGPGHSESVYHRALHQELLLRVVDFFIEEKPTYPILYKGIPVGHLIPDFVLRSQADPALVVVLELKALSCALPKAAAVQIERYRRTLSSSVEILVNFRTSGRLTFVTSRLRSSTPSPEPPSPKRIRSGDVVQICAE